MILEANHDYCSREIGGDLLLIPLGDDVIETDDLIMLNETGAFIWNNVQEPISIEELIRRAKNEFNGSDDQIGQDVFNFIIGMVQIGFIKRRD